MVAWCTGLAVAATALEKAGTASGDHTRRQSLELVARFRTRLASAVAAKGTALAVREQHAALRLLHQVAQVAGGEAQSLELLELFTSGLQTVTELLLVVGDLQVCVKPFRHMRTPGGVSTAPHSR